MRQSPHDAVHSWREAGRLHRNGARHDRCSHPAVGLGGTALSGAHAVHASELSWVGTISQHLLHAIAGAATAIVVYHKRRR
jgi:hypothetical protein